MRKKEIIKKIEEMEAKIWNIENPMGRIHINFNNRGMYIEYNSKGDMVCFYKARTNEGIVNPTIKIVNMKDDLRYIEVEIKFWESIAVEAEIKNMYFVVDTSSKTAIQTDCNWKVVTQY